MSWIARNAHSGQPPPIGLPTVLARSRRRRPQAADAEPSAAPDRRGRAEPRRAEPEQTDAAGPPRGPDDLDDKEKAVVMRLQQRDAEVRAHEAAHAAAAGMLGGGASYDYVTGPDGRQYAVGGEVPVRISSGSTPEEAIRNAQQVRAAALAPAEPSGQDRAVAAQAAAMEAAARAELAELAAARFRAASETAPSDAVHRTAVPVRADRSGQGRAVQESQPASRTEAVRRPIPRRPRASWRPNSDRPAGRGATCTSPRGCGNCSAAAARYV